MALLEDQLVIRRSTLPGAGKGLFTKKFILKGTCIAEYLGKITTWKEVKSDEGKNKYIYFVKRNHVIDAGLWIKARARYANDARGLKKIKGITNNAEYIEDGLRVFIKAKKDISAGSEIFVSYGKEYWETISYNNRLTKQEEREKMNK